jgi:hypothetical protein
VSGGAVQQQPYLDLSDRTRAQGERGLLGLAFHPRFADNGRLFVHYTDLGGIRSSPSCAPNRPTPLASTPAPSA